MRRLEGEVFDEALEQPPATTIERLQLSDRCRPNESESLQRSGDI